MQRKMPPGQIIVHLAVIVMGFAAYLAVTLNSMDGTPVLTLLGGYLGARSIDVGFTVYRNGETK